MGTLNKQALAVQLQRLSEGTPNREMRQSDLQENQLAEGSRNDCLDFNLELKSVTECYAGHWSSAALVLDSVNNNLLTG